MLMHRIFNGNVSIYETESNIRLHLTLNTSQQAANSLMLTIQQFTIQYYC